MILQLCIVLGALWVGSRYGSLALGAISGIGLAILVFGFGLKPGTPPTDVIYIIIAAVTCAGIMQASGGMDWLIQMARPHHIPGSAHHFLPHGTCGYGARGIYSDAYYLRHCPEKGHPP